jgi:hypothetical protein
MAKKGAGRSARTQSNFPKRDFWKSGLGSSSARPWEYLSGEFPKEPLLKNSKKTYRKKKWNLN